MKVKARVRNQMLIPTVQYGNFTLEAEVTMEEDVDVTPPGDKATELTKLAHAKVLESLKEQREALDEFEASFFKQ